MGQQVRGLVWRNRCEQFEVLAILQRMVPRGSARCASQFHRVPMNGNRLGIQDQTDVRLFCQMGRILGQAITHIDQRVDRHGGVDRQRLSYARPEQEMPSQKAAAECTRRDQPVARPRSMSRNWSTFRGLSEQSDRHDQRAVPDVGVSPREDDSELASQRIYPRQQPFRQPGGSTTRQCHCNKCRSRYSGHRRDVAEVDGQRFASSLFRRRTPQGGTGPRSLVEQKIRSLHQHVGGHQARRRFVAAP